MNSIGLEIKKLCETAQTEIVLAAPFIKAPVLKNILNDIKPEITIKCVTRWLPEEIVTGVSDLEVWLIIQSYRYGSLWLRNDLHAKYYRADEQCLVGSANLTAKALGISNQPNLEVLVTVSTQETTIKNFENELLKNCLLVDKNIYEQVYDRVQLLVEKYPKLKTKGHSELEILNNVLPTDNLVAANAWLPTLRNPEDLYLAYSGLTEKLSTASKTAALTDLRSLPLIPALSREVFEAYIATLLLQKPIVQKVDVLVETPQRFGAVRDLLRLLPCASIPEFNAERAWQTLMRWLLYFLPNRYALSVPNYSEVFYRIKTEGR